MQASHEKITSMGLLSYYNGLTLKERVRFKNYVAQLFELSYFTIDGKFSGRTRFSAAEILALQPVVKSESWKQ